MPLSQAKDISERETWLDYAAEGRAVVLKGEVSEKSHHHPSTATAISRLKSLGRRHCKLIVDTPRD